VCVPAGTVDDTFAPHPRAWREIFDTIMSHVESLGPVHADAVKVGVFLKSDRKLAEVRPRARAVELLLALPGPVDHDRVSRVLRQSSDITVNVIPLRSASEVDDQLRGWLTTAYETATD